MLKLLKDYTNDEFLKELGKRITFGRLRWEKGIEFDGLIKIKCPNQTHYVNIRDDEGENLAYWMVEAKQKKEEVENA